MARVWVSRSNHDDPEDVARAAAKQHIALAAAERLGLESSEWFVDDLCDIAKE